MSDDPLFTLATQVNEITTETKADQVATVINRIDWLTSRAREIKKQLEEQLIEWIEENGDIVIGDVRFYVGNKKTDKCMDVSATLHSLFKFLGGDFDQVSSALCSQPVKISAARKILGPELFETYFITITEKDLKTGKPIRTVHRLDTRFVKSNTGNVPDGDSNEA